MNIEIKHLWLHKCPKKWNQYTLIALVITIIVLLILAGVTIATLTGDNGLLIKAGEAKNTTEMSNLQEEVQLAFIENETEKHTNANADMIDKLKSIFEKVHGTEKIDVAKSGKNYKVKVKDTKIVYRVRYDGTVEKYEEMDTTNVYGKLDDENDKILHLKATSSSGCKEIQTDYYNGGGVNSSFSGIEKIIIDEPIAPARIVFRNCSELVEIENIEKLHTENITSMSNMFNGCTKLNNLDVSNFDTSRVTKAELMFRYCENLKSIDLSNFDTSSAENMSSMFYQCKNLTKINLSNFNTENVKSMSNMFWYCSSLTQLDVSHFNTSIVTSLRTMFMGCDKLVNLNLSNWDTNNVSDFYCMFYGCTGLKNANLSGNFKINDDVNYNGIFSYVSYKQGIKIKATQDTADKIISTGNTNTNWYLTMDNFEIVG